jgi:hypothetical protein
MHDRNPRLHVDIAMLYASESRRSRRVQQGKCQGRAIITSAPQRGHEPLEPLNNTSRAAMIMNMVSTLLKTALTHQRRVSETCTGYTRHSLTALQLKGHAGRQDVFSDVDRPLVS